MLPEASDRARRSAPAAFVFLALAAGLAIAVGFSGRVGSPWSPGVSAAMAWAVFALHVALVRTRANPLDPVVWIPVAMLLFYFSIPIAIAAGRAPASGYDVWGIGPPGHLTQGFALALLSLIAFIGGIHLCGLVRQGGEADPPAAAGRGSLAPAGLVVTVIGLVMLVGGIALVGPARVFGNYGDLWFSKSRGLDVRLLGVGAIVTAGGIYSLLASYRPGATRTTVLFPLAAGAFMVLYLVMSGDRGTMVSFVFAAGWVFSRCVRRVPWSLAAVGVLLGLLILPAIKEFREFRDVESTRRQSAQQLASSSLVEMGQTHLVFGHTMDHVPDRRGYAWGMSFVYSTLNTIPNPLPTVGKGFLPSRTEYAPGHWLVSTVNPARYAQGGGYGFALGAEWYFNFGIAGVFFGMVATGFLVAVVRNNAPRSAAFMLFSATFFQMMLALVRNATGGHLKTALWPFLMILGAHVVLGFMGWRQAGSSPPYRPLTTLEQVSRERPGEAHPQ